MTAPLSRREVIKGLATVGALTGSSLTSTKARASSTWDFIVIGAGVFGTWIAWNLQRKGRKVLLLDAWGAAHSRASSGGETRLIRTEYAADPLYSRWAWESLSEWHALSKRHESPIFHQIGALYIYPEDIPRIDRSIAIQRALGIPIEKLSPSELAFSPAVPGCRSSFRMPWVRASFRPVRMCFSSLQKAATPVSTAPTFRLGWMSAARTTTMAFPTLSRVASRSPSMPMEYRQWGSAHRPAPALGQCLARGWRQWPRLQTWPCRWAVRDRSCPGDWKARTPIRSGVTPDSGCDPVRQVIPHAK